MNNYCKTPIYLTTASVLYFYVIETITVANIFLSGEGAKYSLFFLVQPVIRGYLFYKALREPQRWLWLFILLSIVSVIKGVYSFGSSPMEAFYFSSYIVILLSSAWWWLTRYQHDRVEEKTYGLASITMVKLNQPISKAYDIYGEPIKAEKHDKNHEATTYTFPIGEFHEAVISEWNNVIQSITYWSQFSIPGPDLSHMLKQYSDGHGWDLVEEGYLYQRKDRKVRLWCSAMPAIGVGNVEFLSNSSQPVETADT